MRVASYNIRKSIGLDWRRDPSRIADVIAELGADVVALQEADRRFGNKSATLCEAELLDRTGLVPISLSEREVDTGWHGNTILLPPKTPILASERLRLPYLEPRGAILVEFEKDGVPMRLIATHLGLTRQMRRVQLQEIVDITASREEMPTIIAGDFNEWSTLSGLEPLQGRFNIVSPGRSFHSAQPLAALDRIGLTPGIDLHDAGVHETALSRIASDHLPVWVDLMLPVPRRAASSEHHDK